MSWGRGLRRGEGRRGALERNCPVCACRSGIDLVCSRVGGLGAQGVAGRGHAASAIKRCGFVFGDAMRRRLALVLAAVVVVIGSLVVTASAAPATGSISGTVPNSSAVGLPGASVVILAGGAVVAGSATTAPDGRYAVGSLAPDAYTVSFVPPPPSSGFAGGSTPNPENYLAQYYDSKSPGPARTLRGIRRRGPREGDGCRHVLGPDDELLRDHSARDHGRDRQGRPAARRHRREEVEDHQANGRGRPRARQRRGRSTRERRDHAQRDRAAAPGPPTGAARQVDRQHGTSQPALEDPHAPTGREEAQEAPAGSGPAGSATSEGPPRRTLRGRLSRKTRRSWSGPRRCSRAEVFA